MKNLSLKICLAIATLASPVWSETLDNLVFRYEKFFPKFSDEPFNGKIEGLIQGTLKNGLWDGEYLEFRDDGQLKIKVIYKDGKIESPTKKHYQSGSKNLEMVDIPLRLVINTSTNYGIGKKHVKADWEYQNQLSES